MPFTTTDITSTFKSFLESEIENPIIINFYGCSFNFANDGCAESRYYNGDDIFEQNDK